MPQAPDLAGMENVLFDKGVRDNVKVEWMVLRVAAVQGECPREGRETFGERVAEIQMCFARALELVESLCGGPMPGERIGRRRPRPKVFE